ncbi:MAG: glycerophosphodiester phosphodiesterase family protein [Candidatus Thorarchaeota archaeon]|jgi:glycerophosphoryl diester phosphodiesterase
MKPIVIAHKGASGYAPENTLLSFQRAIDLEAHMIELDLRETLDGELVCVHDPTVDRTTNGIGAIHELTYKELRGLDAGEGEHIPLLTEVLRLASGKIKVNIDLKVIEVEQKLLDLIEDYKMIQDVLVSSFFHGTLGALRDLSENIETAVLIEVPIDDLVVYALDFNVNAINPDHKLVTLELVEEAHSVGLKVYPWTVNDLQTMKQLLAFGVDGLITDYPDRAAGVI